MEPFSVTEAMVEWLTSMGYQTSSQVPGDPMPDEFVTVSRMGGPTESYVDRPSLAVQCWASSEDAVELMASRLRLDILTHVPPAGVHSVGVDSGPYPFPDPETRRPRWQMSVDVACQLAI